MSKKMHSFRLDEDLIQRAKVKAGQLGISLSALISIALTEKLDSYSYLKEITKELRLLRQTLK